MMSVMVDCQTGTDELHLSSTKSKGTITLQVHVSMVGYGKDNTIL